MTTGRLLFAAIGILFAATLFVLPQRGVAQHWVCGGGPGPGEIQIGSTQGSNGVASVPLCAKAGPAPPPIPFTILDRSFGALAYDAARAGWTISIGYPNARSAKSAAIAECQRGTDGSCQAMLSFTNQCAAVARALQEGETKAGMDSVNTGSSLQEAERNADKSCRADWGTGACKVMLSDCSKHSTRVVQ